MAKVRLGLFEIREYELPAVCAKCGRDADASPPHKFSSSPRWLSFVVLVAIFGSILFIGFFVIGIPLYVILGIVLTRRMVVPLPLCERHRSYWRNRKILTHGGFLAVTLLGGLALVAAAFLSREGYEKAWLFAALVTAGLFLVWLIVAAVVSSGGIRATEITERSVSLVGLSREFVAAVREDRRGPEEEEEDEDEPPRARRPAKDEDDGGYYDPDRRRRRRREDDDEDER